MAQTEAVSMLLTVIQLEACAKFFFNPVTKSGEEVTYQLRK
jgi:hypothetical protein